MSFPNQFPQQPPHPQQQPQPQQPQQGRMNHFAAWAAVVQSRKNFDQNKILAAGMAMESLEAAIAVGMSCLPPEKFSTANAIELAKLITDTEFNLRAELAAADETGNGGTGSEEE